MGWGDRFGVVHITSTCIPLEVTLSFHQPSCKGNWEMEEIPGKGITDSVWLVNPQ